MRLIDADAFIEYLGLDAENAREDNVGEIVTLEDFDRQPTAFNKEKVIKELNRCSVYQFQCKLPDGRICHFSDMVNIVKKGGLE